MDETPPLQGLQFIFETLNSIINTTCTRIDTCYRLESGEVGEGEWKGEREEMVQAMRAINSQDTALKRLRGMSRKMEKELGSLMMGRRWNDHSEEEGAISDQSVEGETSGNCSGKMAILQRSRACSDDSMEEEETGEKYSGVFSRNSFVKSFQNIGILGDWLK